MRPVCTVWLINAAAAAAVRSFSCEPFAVFLLRLHCSPKPEPHNFPFRSECSGHSVHSIYHRPGADCCCYATHYTQKKLFFSFFSNALDALSVQPYTVPSSPLFFVNNFVSF